MKKILENIEYPGLLLLVGVFFILAGYFEIQDISELRIIPLSEPDYLILCLGMFVILTSVGMYAYSRKLGVEAKRNITKTAEAVMGRRFANLIYIYARDKKAIAMGLHEGLRSHKGKGVHLPPGGRLDVYEMPHENVLRIVRDQIGLKLDFDNFVSFIKRDRFTVTDDNAQRIGETEICPSPIWTQLEMHKQRPDHIDKSEVDEHFDFIFLCVIDHAVDLKGGVRKDTGWFSEKDIKEMLKGESGRRTYVDVYAGFKEIEKIVDRENA